MAEGKKVSRAAGNDLTLERPVGAGFRRADGPLLAAGRRTTARCCTTRSANYSGPAQCVARLNEFAARLAAVSEPASASRRLDQTLHEVQAGWQEALDNDLNVPKALGKLFAFIRQINRLLDARRTGRRPGGADPRLHASGQ